MEWARGLERLLEVFQACSAPTGLRFGGMVSCGDQLVPTVLPILVSPVAVLLGRGRIISAVTTTKVADGLFASGVLGGTV